MGNCLARVRKPGQTENAGTFVLVSGRTRPVILFPAGGILNCASPTSATALRRFLHAILNAVM